MQWIALARIILSLMQTIEPLFGSGTGAVKKQAVTETAKTLVDSVQSISTGGQKKTWDEIATPVSEFIDTAAGFLFQDTDDSSSGA
jgi:hypothetical protein